jgi:high-affinity iron transporter
MFSAALIVFRETLEAVLVVGIVAAAVQSIPRRQVWIALGVGVGIVGSIAVAAAAQTLQRLADGMGQEWFNAAVLSLALGMLAWHNIWMSRHGAQLAAQARTVGQAVRSGELALTAVSTAIALTVLREGAETVLFLYGIWSGSQLSAFTVASGAAVGLGSGALVGWLVYRGLMRIPVRRLFSVTSWLILLLAAGMAGQLARTLIQADVLPPLAEPLWDTSKWLPPGSAIGTTLHALIGYDAQPSATQVMFYAIALVSILLAMRRARAPRPSPQA